jgi:uncharacterized membrane protein
MIGSLLTWNHIIDALVAVLVCLRAALAVIHICKRRLEKLLERLEDRDGEWARKPSLQAPPTPT